MAKGDSFDQDKSMQKVLEEGGFNTRVVAFFYDKDDFKPEIEMLKHTGKYLANRYNLRIGIVTDKKLITRMKKSHAELFLDVGMSTMVARRYDGQLFKLNVADSEPARYVWWITVHSVKPVEKVSPAVYQICESARMPLVTAFVDFKDPKAAANSRELVANMEALHPEFVERMMLFWTDDPWYKQQKSQLGITWDEEPSMGMNSVEHIIYSYPQGEPFDKESVRRWFNQISLKKTAESDMVQTDFAKRQRDPTLAEFFLNKPINIDRKTFQEVVLREDADSLVLFYTTENINYVQRKACYQYNLVAETFADEALYGDTVPRLLKFYAYDSYLHGFPKGVPYGKSPPHDTRGTEIVSDEQRAAGMPALYIFPNGRKGFPYKRYNKFPYADDMIGFILENAQNYYGKLKAEEFEGLGRGSVEEARF